MRDADNRRIFGAGQIVIKTASFCERQQHGGSSSSNDPGQIPTELIAGAGRKGASLMRVASVALGGDGEAGDAVRIGDERIGIRQTAPPSGRPLGADISGSPPSAGARNSARVEITSDETSTTSGGTGPLSEVSCGEAASPTATT